MQNFLEKRQNSFILPIDFLQLGFLPLNPAYDVSKPVQPGLQMQNATFFCLFWCYRIEAINTLFNFGAEDLHFVRC